MNLFCKDCKKVFPVPPDSAVPGNVTCPKCGKEYAVSEEKIFTGRVIGGDFLVESFIGKGGMGDIYLAKQISLDREVALKILQNKFSEDGEYIDGLFHEARAAAKVSHPNVVQAYAVGEEDGIFYFAMEYIRGETFKQILQREKKISSERALKVVREIAGAIDAAWREQRLVHQDIKPDNIMLDANGFAKLADLGLARKAGVNDEHAQAGDEVMGTPQYISPEQLTGVPTDVRSDIYSLGATFYHLVTGRFAYLADTIEEMSRKHVEGHLESPNTVDPDIPDSVNAIIVKMMARHIEERYQTPQELIKDIDKAMQDGLSGKKAAPPSINLKLKKNSVVQTGRKTLSAAAGQIAISPKAIPVVANGAKKPAAIVSTAKQVVSAESASSSDVKSVDVAVSSKVAAQANVKTAEQTVKSAIPDGETKTSAGSDSEHVNEKGTPAVDSVNPETDKKTEQSNEHKSVRSALIAKHNDAAVSADEQEEFDELFADTPVSSPKKSKLLPIILFSCAAVLLLAISAVIVICSCSDKAWMPGFAKSCGGKLNSARKELIGKIFSGKSVKVEKSEKNISSKVDKKTSEPEKKVPETRKEFLDKVDKFLSLYRNNPEQKAQWHKLMQPEVSYFMSAQTDVERRSAKPLILIWHHVDDMIVFSPYRQKAQAARIERIRQAEEKARIAREAEELRVRREQEKKAAEQARIEQESKKIEKERQQHLAVLKKELYSLVTPLFDGAWVIFRGGDDSAYLNALQNIKQYNIPYAENNDEQKVINAYKKHVAAIQKCVTDFKNFVDKVADVSDKVITIRIRNGNRRQVVQMLGLSVDGTLTYRPIGGKKTVATDLKSQRGLALSTPLKVIKDLKNVDFYTLLIRGGSVKELLSKAPTNEWKSMCNKISL